jgi:hypothetical protein
VNPRFQRLAGKPPGTAEDSGMPDAAEAGFFATQFQDEADPAGPRATWTARATQIHAEPCDAQRGGAIFMRLWGQDRHFSLLSADDLARMSTYLDYALIPANQEVIRQNEQGDYLVIVLDGTIVVDRVQPWGGRARLAEAHVGDMLGEMSLLDAGARFSACTTLTPSLIAVLDAQRLDDMVARDPRLALALLASLSRRLSLRLRQVSARLSALLSRA